MSISSSPAASPSPVSSSARYYYDLVKFPPADTIKIITFLLERITKTNDRIAINNGKRYHQDSSSPYALFYAKAIPVIDIQSYFTRISKYCPCTNECFLSLLVYLDRMSKKSRGLRIDSYNIHRLIITGMMVASKFFSDVFYTNARYAKVGGLPIQELNALELQFLKLNDFELNVQVEELQQYGNRVVWHWAVQMSKCRKLQQQPLISPNNIITSVDTHNNDTAYTVHNNSTINDEYTQQQHQQHYRPQPVNTSVTTTTTTIASSSPVSVTYTSSATNTPKSGIHSCSSNVKLFHPYHHREKPAVVVPAKEFVDSI